MSFAAVLLPEKSLVTSFPNGSFHLCLTSNEILIGTAVVTFRHQAVVANFSGEFGVGSVIRLKVKLVSLHKERPWGLHLDAMAIYLGVLTVGAAASTYVWVLLLRGPNERGFFC